MLFKPPDLWYFVIAAQAPKTASVEDFYIKYNIKWAESCFYPLNILAQLLNL